MNNDNGANDTNNNGNRAVVDLLETERQELNRLRRKFEIKMRMLQQERVQLLRERDRLVRVVQETEDDADARDVLLERRQQPFQVRAITLQVLAREQQQQQLADSVEEDTDTVSPAMVEPNP